MGSSGMKRKVVLGIDGGTESIRAGWFDAMDGRAIGKSCASSYETFHPQAGWAEQDPKDWYNCLKDAIHRSLEELTSHTNTDEYEMCGMCLDTTCCSVVALNDKFEPLRRSLLWMDGRAAPIQTEQIMKSKDEALKINCDGLGPLSAEWMTPKALWLAQNQPHVYANATYICEYQDYMNYKLTGVYCGSQCNAASRWHYTNGPPQSMYDAIGIPDLSRKLPSSLLPMGSTVGHLTKEAALDLNLPEGLLVAQGGPDAFVGMIGLGCISPGQYCLITGSSHLHCIVLPNTTPPTTARGMWGAYSQAPLPSVSFAEGGQSSTGSLLRWFQRLLQSSNDNNSNTNDNSNTRYKQLDEEASRIAPGSDGLVALETFQGARTPVTDPLAKGALIGLSLAHSRAHIYRALMEAVCFGTRACMEGLLSSTTTTIEEIVLAGGITRSPLWLQMHADITGKPIVLNEQAADAPLLGCAILASVAAGIHPTVSQAVSSMVRIQRRIQPNPTHLSTYTHLYKQVYQSVRPAIQPIVHTIHSLRGGDNNNNNNNHNMVISPSLLAANWADMRLEVQKCIKAKLPHLHVDVFDGVFLDSPYALTFGPQMVQAIRQCATTTEDDDELLFLDVHLCVDRPQRYVDAMAQAGANRIIFQIEAFHENDIQAALLMIQSIHKSNMSCGISINPSTPIQRILPLLPHIDIINLLAVEPGFGGQSFQPHILQKIKYLQQHKQHHYSKLPTIMVDGGVNSNTISSIHKAGANIVVAGSFLFQHPSSFQQGLQELHQSLQTSQNN